MSDLRICPECGIKHSCVIEETATGKILHRFDKCRGCLLGVGPKAKSKQILEQITLHESPVEKNI
jgi:hypothetical protein